MSDPVFAPRSSLAPGVPASSDLLVTPPPEAPRPTVVALDGGEAPSRMAAERVVVAPAPSRTAGLTAPRVGRRTRPPVAAQVAGAAPVAGNPELLGLKQGARGDAVAELQRALIRSGASLEADGAFGALTDRALRAFQTAKGLQADGVVGPNTLRALGIDVGATPARAADPGQLGPNRVRRVTMQIPVNGGTTTADVYLPSGPGPFPAVIDIYGLTRGRANHAGTATHFASWGMIVVVPQLPHGSGSPGANAEHIQAMTRWLNRQSALAGKPLDNSRGVGLTGHSFGGLTALLAADQPGVGAVVALDPADYFGQGRRAAPGITAPAAFVVGRRELFNQFGNGHDLYDDVSSRTKQMVRVNHAWHMDFENGDPAGPKNAANRVAMRFATAFLLRHLQGKTEYDAYGPRGTATRRASARGELY